MRNTQHAPRVQFALLRGEQSRIVNPNIAMISDSHSPSDEDLTRQAQAGSMAAFEELVTRYERRIYAFVAQSCRNGMDAAEITQETFVKAYRAICRFNPKRTFAPWLFTIARRKCVDSFRAIPPTSNENPAPELSDDQDPAEILAAYEDRQCLWSVARCVLPEPQFHALWLRYVEDMSIAEIARVLRRPQGYVKVLLFRARKALAIKLKPASTFFHSPAETFPRAYEILAL